MYAGGDFHRATDSSRSRTYVRHNLMAFNAVTGRISKEFRPDVNGPVWAIAARRGSLFIAGKFTRVNGVRQHAVAKISKRTGALDRRFSSPFTTGKATDIRLVRDHLVVAGTFTRKLTSINRITGNVDGWLRMRIRGSVSPKAGPTAVYRFSVTPQETRLVAIGNFTSVNGEARSRAFMVRLSPATRPVLSPWFYPPLTHLCHDEKVPDYLRGVDFSPDGSYFVLVASGYVPATPDRVGSDVCDAAARFSTRVVHPSAPVWINYTGGDTLHSVAVTDKAVYVQGHMRWLNNPRGKDSAGPGAVARPGIGAIDPATGKALPWNPGKTRGIGGKVLYVKPGGLWVGSDGARLAGEYHNNIAFLPVK